MTHQLAFRRKPATASEPRTTPSTASPVKARQIASGDVCGPIPGVNRATIGDRQTAPHATYAYLVELGRQLLNAKRIVVIKTEYSTLPPMGMGEGSGVEYFH